MKFTVYDDSGILSIINIDKYISFVADDATAQDILLHATQEMNNQHAILWQACKHPDKKICIEFRNSATDLIPFDEILHTIEVTDEKLYIVNFTDLAMVAQFDDIILPCLDRKDWSINLPNGLYQLNIRKMFDEEDEWNDDINTHYEIIINPAESGYRILSNGIYWYKNED